MNLSPSQTEALGMLAENPLTKVHGKVLNALLAMGLVETDGKGHKLTARGEDERSGVSGTAPDNLPPGITWEPGEGKVGADPRTLNKDVFLALGHEELPILRVIRAKCLDCCCGAESEVRRCPATTCALWPYRMAKNPLRAPKIMTPEQKLAAADRMRRLAANRGTDEDEEENE